MEDCWPYVKAQRADLLHKVFADSSLLFRPCFSTSPARLLCCCPSNSNFPRSLNFLSVRKSSQRNKSFWV